MPIPIPIIKPIANNINNIIIPIFFFLIYPHNSTIRNLILLNATCLIFTAITPRKYPEQQMPKKESTFYQPTESIAVTML